MIAYSSNSSPPLICQLVGSDPTCNMDTPGSPPESPFPHSAVSPVNLSTPSSLSFQSQEHHFGADCLSSPPLAPFTVSEQGGFGPWVLFQLEHTQRTVNPPLFQRVATSSSSCYVPKQQKRAERSCQKEAHSICSETHEYYLVPEWEVSVMHEVLLVSTHMGSQTAHQCSQLCHNSIRAEPACCAQRPKPWHCPQLSQHNATGKHWLLRASQTSFPSPNSAAAKCARFPCYRVST